MKALFLTGVPEQRKARALLVIRSTLHELGNGDATHIRAAEIQDRVSKGERVLLGLLENTTPQRTDVLRASLEDAGCETAIDEYEVVADDDEDDEPGEVDEDFEYSTGRDLAIYLLGQCGGQPIAAAAVAAGLYRITHEEAFTDCIEVLANIFPHAQGEIAKAIKV